MTLPIGTSEGWTMNAMFGVGVPSERMVVQKNIRVHQESGSQGKNLPVRR